MIICVILGWAFNLSLKAQDQVYRHPFFDISFRASPNWKTDLRTTDGKTFEVTNPNNNMQIGIRFEEGNRNPLRCLRKISGREGLINLRGPYDTVLNDHSAYVLNGACLIEKVPYRRFIVAIPASTGIFLVEFTCPEDCYRNHRAQLYRILDTLRIGT